ncbi:MAG TPA: hypothetical protein DCM05_03240 [Elusimicrobia bacterium]|nr:hypothetical protein [Elusimicrobiota bacterium]
MRSNLFRALTAFVLVSALATGAQALWGFGEKKAPPLVSASIASAQGDVQLKKAQADWGPALAGSMLGQGDQVRTGASGNAILAFSDGTKVQIGANAAETVSILEPGKVEINFAVGKLDAWVKKLKGRRFTVRTPSAVCSVRGTEFSAEVTPAGQTTWDVFGGQVEVADNFGRQTTVDAGQRMVAPAPAAAGAPPPVEAKPVPIPATVKPVVEPVVPLPPAPSQAAAPAPAPAPAPAESTTETAAEPAEALPPPPPPNPVQEEQTASPSTP